MNRCDDCGHEFSDSEIKDFHREDETIGLHTKTIHVPHCPECDSIFIQDIGDST
ncbi:MAG: hypothetical protein ABEK36_04600 [Candidatus Aenigmatarchaeota archaeon]